MTQIKEEDDIDDYEECPYCWSDLIFLPFHPVFKIFVLLSVITKSMLGPLSAVFGIVSCSEVMDKNIYFLFIKYFYMYFCDSIYLVDTFLHVVHRQVTDQAMRREYLPKSAFHMLIDVIALIPFYALTTNDICSNEEIWPTILAFSEFILIYRVVEYFELVSTHSIWQLLLGSTIVLFLCVNCMGCFLVMLTRNGLCERCREGIYDWRAFVAYKLNETNVKFSTYVYGTSFILSSFLLNSSYDQTSPSTIMEFFVVSLFLILIYILNMCILLPKLFSESMLTLRRICTVHPRVMKFVEETKRRHFCPTSHTDVAKFYSLIWKKRQGITNIPDSVSEFPRYLRIDIRQDLVWPIFYHSPTLRNTSMSFKRWICEFIRLDYKLPGEKFFSGHYCHTNLYYLKSGIVEMNSADDGVTPMLSLTSGTLLGDVSFVIPPLKRVATVRCVTYCEVFVLSRHDIIKGMQHFPNDKVNILRLVKERLNHARTLYTCKQHIRGLDRVEDEGIAWLKRRWWEISEAVTTWKRVSGEDQIKCDLPQEEAVYHCAKYIGQLVLSEDVRLQKSSLFANVNFPWVLMPESSFVRFWHIVINITVFVVLITYPPNTIQNKSRNWFKFIQYMTDSIYAVDICMSLLTSTGKNSVHESFITVLFTRCKTLPFVLDILATVWIETIVSLLGRPDLYDICQLNRLIKVYILFNNYVGSQWNITIDPLINVAYILFLTIFCYLIITSFTLYIVWLYVPNITKSFFFGKTVFHKNISGRMVEYDVLESNYFGVPLSFAFENLFAEVAPQYLADIYSGMIFCLVGFYIYTASKGKVVAFLYLRNRNSTFYQSFVTNLKQYYGHIGIHRDLMRRLDNYLVCQWKYHKGIDIIYPNDLKEEPFDIYWKVHGEIAEKIIGQSKPFVGADSTIVRELAYATRFLILGKNITLFISDAKFRSVLWIVQGNVRAEYYNEQGELLVKNYGPGDFVTETVFFSNRSSLMTYASSSDCELLYLRVQDFLSIMKRHSVEWTYFQKAMQEFNPQYQTMYKACVEACENHLSNSFVNAHRNLSQFPESGHFIVQSIDATDTNEYLQPDSSTMYYWMIFRAVVVVISIINSSLQGGSGAVIRQHLIIIGHLCDCISFIDIIIKMKMPYFNKQGILIKNFRMCFLHYISRGFFLDIIGAIPWYEIIRAIMTRPLDVENAMLLNTICKFAHLYILMDAFNYIADRPTINTVFILIVKWQVVSLLVLVGVSHYLTRHCIKFNFDKHGVLLNMKRRDKCWMPSYFSIDEHPTVDQLHLVYAESINLGQAGLLKMIGGKFSIDRSNRALGFTLIAIGILFWYVTSYSVTFIMLSIRGNTIFQHGVSQLQNFLVAERVDNTLIKNAISHFNYWWLRTRGTNIHILMFDQVGVVFRQDLNYYLYKKTFSALNILLKSAEPLERPLSSSVILVYFRPGEHVMREMDLLAYLYIVHRGNIIISKEGKTLAVLTKGSIFGPLNSSRSRPVLVTATAETYADLFQVAIKQFQDIITDEIRSNIEKNPQSKDDYMCQPVPVHRSPHNDIDYILRGTKIIHLPWMKEPVKALRSMWYTRWLYLAWLVAPSLSLAAIFLIPFFQTKAQMNLTIYFVIVLDLIHLAQFISEFYTIEVLILSDKLVKRRVGYRIMRRWSFYVDLVSMILPFMTLFNGGWYYQLTRLLRLRLFYEFFEHQCINFKSRVAPVVFKFTILVLSWHFMTCGWVYIACREDKFPVNLQKIPPKYNAVIDYHEWMDPRQRAGCARMTMIFKSNVTEEDDKVSFLVPRNWVNDYIVAFIYVLILHTHSIMNIAVPLNLVQIYYKLVIQFLVYVLDVWIMSVVISAVYTKYRELYHYDYQVQCVSSYLQLSGLSPSLLNDVKEYTRQLWQRQRGNWLPELTHQAPTCLREDLLGALYIHHLMVPSLFKNLPEYFTRQLAARFQRIVLFPGKCIVQEGDIHACMFFIHEGEVEKWYCNRSGERRMMTILTVNNYFGIIPTLFNVPFAFSYYSKTVVDLVYLKFSCWRDLLDAYPTIKEDLLQNAQKIKVEQGRNFHNSKIIADTSEIASKFKSYY